MNERHASYSIKPNAEKNWTDIASDRGLIRSLASGFREADQIKSKQSIAEQKRARMNVCHEASHARVKQARDEKKETNDSISNSCFNSSVPMRTQCE